MQTTFERLGITYRQEGDYLLPNIEAPESPQIGFWGQRRLKYLRENKEAGIVADGKQFEQYEMTKSLLFALSCSAFWVGMLNAIPYACKGCIRGYRLGVFT